jgi:hypothetical protein
MASDMPFARRQKTLPRGSRTSANIELTIEVCGEFRDVWQRSAIDGGDRNRPTQAAGPEGAS